MELRITGLEQVQRRLKSAPAKLVEGAFAQALDRAIGVIAAEVEARTPEGPELGLLKSSVITDVKIDDNLQGGTAACGFNKKISPRTGKPQDAIAYWVEFGHAQVTHGKNKRSRRVVGHVPAHPFMRPAAEAAADRAIAVFADNLIDKLSVIEED